MYIMTSIMLVNGYAISNRFTHLKYCSPIMSYPLIWKPGHVYLLSTLSGTLRHCLHKSMTSIAFNCHPFTAFLSCSRSSLFSSSWSLRRWIRWILSIFLILRQWGNYSQVKKKNIHWIRRAFQGYLAVTVPTKGSLGRCGNFGNVKPRKQGKGGHCFKKCWLQASQNIGIGHWCRRPLLAWC